MKFNKNIIWILLFGISLLYDSSLVMGNAVNCSGMCEIMPDWNCASWTQIYLSNLLIIAGIGCFLAAIRVLIFENLRPPKQSILNLNN